MPEGDTIHRLARSLRAALAGHRVVRFSSCLPALDDAALEGLRVAEVTSRGKHLLVRFEDGRTLHTHLGMKGRWRLRPTGSSRPPSARRAVALIETEGWFASCVDAPLCELLPPGREPGLVRRLGPDLLDPEGDLAEARRRLRALGDTPLGVALMRQSAVAGIGNVFKSEILFLVREDPFAPVSSLDDERLDGVLAEARRQLSRNAARRVRVTRRRFGGARHWVYRRRGEPCFECGARVAMRRQGPQLRSTYYCPACQRVADDPVTR